MHEDPVAPLRRQLVDHILQLAARTNMHVAAGAMGIDAPRMSDLRHGRIEQFSLERLIRMLDAVDRRVGIEVEAVVPGEVRWWDCLRVQDSRRKRRKDFRWEALFGKPDEDGPPARRQP